MSRLPLLVAAGLFAWAGGLGAQAVRSSAIDAGDVATLILQAEAPAGADSASYTAELRDGFRPLGPVTARVGRLDDLFLVPLTVATPARLPAGDVVAGRLVLRIDGREPAYRELVVRVRERREIAFHLDVEETTVPADGETGIPYRLYNRGNVADTVWFEAAAGEGWLLVSPPRIILQPGDSVNGGLRVAAPPSAEPGERRYFPITARTGARELTRPLGLVVVTPSGWLGSLAHVPSSLFVGHSLSEGGGLVAALSGGGSVGPDTDVRLDLRYTEAGILDPALQRQMAGAGLRFSLQRPDLRLSAGDVYSPRNTVTGSFSQARGVDARWDPAGPVRAGAFAAVPTGFAGDRSGGHILQADGALETAFGEVGVLAGDMVQPGVGSRPGSRSTGAGARWSGARGVHSGAVETSLVRLAAGDTAVRTGAALQLDYRLEAGSVSGRLGLRRVPGGATPSGGEGNQLAGSLSARLLPSVHAIAWAYQNERRILGTPDESSARAAHVGLRGRFGRVQLQLGGMLSDRAAVTAIDSFRFGRTTGRAEASWVRGRLSLQADLEAGTARELGARGPFRAAGSSIRWYAGARSGWLRVQHTERPAGLAATSVQAGGHLTAGPVDLTGGFTHSVSGGVGTSALWTTTAIELQRNLVLQLGASARPSMDPGDWSFSLGLRRRLNLPLPLVRQPDLFGVVFDDADADGVRDPGEAPVPDATLALGYLETTTDGDGRYRFRDATGTPLRVVTGRLPLGYVLPPEVALGSRGEQDIPLVRTATLHLELFLDRDEDGERDSAESPGSGAVVVLTDARGRRRTATADDDGAVRISGLLPGRYAVTARPLDPRGRDRDPEVLMEVELAPGAEAHHVLAVPLRRRTIRMEGGGLLLDAPAEMEPAA